MIFKAESGPESFLPPLVPRESVEDSRASAPIGSSERSQYECEKRGFNGPIDLVVNHECVLCKGTPNSIHLEKTDFGKIIDHAGTLHPELLVADDGQNRPENKKEPLPHIYDPDAEGAELGQRSTPISQAGAGESARGRWTTRTEEEKEAARDMLTGS